jgi:hypothetical protein
MRTLHLVSLAFAGAVAAVLIVPTPVRAQQVDIKPSPKVKKDKYVITKDEIAQRADLVSGYDVVKALRSQWLRVTRGSGSALAGADPTTGAQDKLCSGGRTDPGCTAAGTSDKSSPVPHESGSPYAESGASINSPGKATPVLYIDEIKQQDGLDQLKNLRASEVLEIRYMTGNEASGRYGAGHENGAILVKMLKTGRG